MRQCERLGRFAFVGALLLLLAACGPPHSQQQEALAEALGIRVEGQTYSAIFPLDYFRTRLHRGTSTIDEVHEVMQGYERVLNCSDGGQREVYYYYSTEDNKALRIEVWYTGGRLLDLNTEDDDSRTIQVKGCIPGRFGESGE
jgi:hypothetical protein